MGAAIMPVAEALESNVERCLPPEHRVLARRQVSDRPVVELIIDGPLLPEPVDGVYLLTVLEFLVHPDPGDVVRLTGRWRWIASENVVSSSEPWEIGVWRTPGGMMEYLFQGVEAPT